MTLLDILVLVSLIALAGSFWQMREFAELARLTGQQYCKKHQLIFVSIARDTIHWRPTGTQKRFQFDYIMEFTTDNERLYRGVISVYKNKIVAIELPAYRSVEE